MKLVVQRSLESFVKIDGKINGEIKKGLVVFVGFTTGDDECLINKMVEKLVNLRVFKDDKDLMNLSLLDTNGEILSISQFTLYADATEGRRPSLIKAMNSIEASKLYDYFNDVLIQKNIKVQTGIFGSNMEVNIKNDGPVTIILDSNEIIK